MVSSCSCPKGYVCKCVKTRKKVAKKAKVVVKPQKELPTVNKERQEDKERLLKDNSERLRQVDKDRLHLLIKSVIIAEKSGTDEDLDKSSKLINEHKKYLSDESKKELKEYLTETSEPKTKTKKVKKFTASKEPTPPSKKRKVQSGKPIKSFQKGSGDGEGLYDSQIDDLMDNVNSYVGTIAADEMDSLNIKDKMSFIMNTDNSNEPGRHWVAVYIDKNGDKEVNYYDPFGDEPTKETLQGLKMIIDEMDPDTLLKFKINAVKNQDVNSDTCGWHCMRFIKDRESGMSFKDSTGFDADENQDNSKEKEEDIEDDKKQLGFGYL